MYSNNRNGSRAAFGAGFCGPLRDHAGDGARLALAFPAEAAPFAYVAN